MRKRPQTELIHNIVLNYFARINHNIMFPVCYPLDRPTLNARTAITTTITVYYWRHGFTRRSSSQSAFDISKAITAAESDSNRCVFWGEEGQRWSSSPPELLIVHRFHKSDGIIIIKHKTYIFMWCFPNENNKNLFNKKIKRNTHVRQVLLFFFFVIVFFLTSHFDYCEC